MEQTTNLSLTGASDVSYIFQVFAWGAKFSSIGAVYAIFQKTALGRYNILYIGQTEDLSQRFENHHKQACFDRNGKTHIGIRTELTESYRFNIETDLVRHYNPTCND